MKNEFDLDIMDDRNRTVHIYNQEDIKKIYSHIVNQYSDAFGRVLIKLKSLN